MTGNAHEAGLAGVYGAAYLAAGLDQDPASAARLIAPVFARLDPDTTAPHPLLVELALLWSAVSTEAHDAPAPVVDWGWYAIRAALLLHGAGHRAVRDALRAQATVLACRGEHLAAAELYRRVMVESRSAGLAELATGSRVDRAVQLHAGGRCSAGLAELTNVWRGSSTAHGDDDTQRYADALVAMLRACGRIDEARRRAHEAFPGRPRLEQYQPVDAAGEPEAAIGHVLVCQYARHCSLGERLSHTGLTRTDLAQLDAARTDARLTDPTRKVWEDLLNDEP